MPAVPPVRTVRAPLIEMNTKSLIFKTPPMSGSIKVLTYIIAALPVPLAYAGFTVNKPALYTWALFLVLLSAGVWLWMRPTHYEIDSRALTVVWPLRKYVVPKSSINRVRVLDDVEIKKELGSAVRIGVGGLFGGFGLLWTRRRGLIRFYITRCDSLVMIDRNDGRSFLITVDNPHGMVKELEGGEK
jgi:hypothetical protein